MSVQVPPVALPSPCEAIRARVTGEARVRSCLVEARGTVQAISTREAWPVGIVVRIVALIHCPVSTVPLRAGAAVLARALVVAVSVGIAVAQLVSVAIHYHGADATSRW